MIAFERGDHQVKAVLRSASKIGAQIVVPAGVLAQVWRGGPRSASLARLLDAVEVDSLDAERAKEIGVRLGDRDGDDVIDAHVVCCVGGSPATIATSDPDDIGALIDPGERLALIQV